MPSLPVILITAFGHEDLATLSFRGASAQKACAGNIPFSHPGIAAIKEKERGQVSDGSCISEGHSLRQQILTTLK
jgi:hypothetical protein